MKNNLLIAISNACVLASERDGEVRASTYWRSRMISFFSGVSDALTKSNIKYDASVFWDLGLLKKICTEGDSLWLYIEDLSGKNLNRDDEDLVGKHSFGLHFLLMSKYNKIITDILLPASERQND